MESLAQINEMLKDLQAYTVYNKVGDNTLMHGHTFITGGDDMRYSTYGIIIHLIIGPRFCNDLSLNNDGTISVGVRLKTPQSQQRALIGLESWVTNIERSLWTR